MSRWGDEKTLYFIQLYRQGECLWNTKSPLYKNKLARETAYQDILEAFNDPNLDEKGIKNKIKNLRSVYHTELKKVRDSMRSGDAMFEYEPSLSWFDEMDSFLGDMVEDRSETVVGNLNVKPVRSGQDDTTTKQDNSPNDKPITTEGALEPNSVPLLNTTSEEPNCSPNPSSIQKKTRTNKGVINFRKRTYETILTNALQRLENAVSNVVNTTNKREASLQSEDEFHTFAMSVAAQLRQLPLNVAVATQSNIQGMLTEARLALIFADSPTQPATGIMTKTEGGFHM